MGRTFNLEEYINMVYSIIGSHYDVSKEVIREYFESKSKEYPEENHQYTIDELKSIVRELISGRTIVKKDKSKVGYKYRRGFPKRGPKGGPNEGAEKGPEK